MGLAQRVTLVPSTHAAALYCTAETVEHFRCNFGVNPAYVAPLRDAGLTPSGFGDDGELRIVELADHPFFLATLFLPQMRSAPARPHPLLAGFARALANAVIRPSM